MRVSVALFWWVTVAVIAGPFFEFLGGIVAGLTS